MFGPHSQVLDVGRAERVYTGALRRAVITRDRHCAYPACHQPPRLGEIHHIKHWAAHGGETSVTNGVLLCWHHHDVVHTRHLIIHRNPTRARWDFTEADGTPIPHPGDRSNDPGLAPTTGGLSPAERHRTEPSQGRGLPPGRSAPPESGADHEIGRPPNRGAPPGRSTHDIPDRDTDPATPSLFDEVG